MKTSLIQSLLVLILSFPVISAANDFNPFTSSGSEISIYPIEDTPREITYVIELNSGMRDSKEIVNPYYTGSLRFYTEFSYLKNAARIAPFIGGAFENPGGSFEAGLRNDIKLYRIQSDRFSLIEFRGGLSYFYSFYNKLNFIGVDVKVDFLDFVYLAVRFNKSLNNSDYTIMPDIGVYF
ncbi:MAG: hypothetical protein JNJ56_05535 [Ignavibacteria bacterium]|nr:hypothetical protein [Ignavibacteria bacterium]